MTLRVVSSNEDAQQQHPAGSSEPTTNTMEATSSSKGLTESQDSGYGGSQPASPPARYLGQNLRITACANQGGRKYMEDRVHVRVHRNDITGAIDWTYVAVYDGHGGPEASEYCRRHLLKNIMAEKNFDSENDKEFLEAIRSGFLKTHHTMWKDVDSWARTASGYPSTAGTTASCAFIRRGKVYVGHVGDSAILLTTRTSADKFHRLTEDHKPELPSERRRIEASGGQIAQKQCVYRVVWTRAGHAHVGPIRRNTPTQCIPFLAVARSLGDFWSYVESTQEFAVSPIPDVSVTELTSEHHALILASDGLTNVVTAELEAAMLYDLAQEELQKDWFKDSREHPNHARILMRRTMLNWRRFRADNVSVLTVIFADEESRSPSSPCSSPDETMDLLSEDISPSSRPLSPIAAPVEVPVEEDVDAQLVAHPLCMMHVTNERAVRYATAPVTLKYNGHFDNNFFSVDSVGPGFISHDAEGEAEAARSEAVASRAARLQEYYDMLGSGGERDVTPAPEENQPPATSTANLTNSSSSAAAASPATPVATTTAAAGETRKPPIFTSAAAIIIDELRRSGDAAAASAASAAAAAVAAEGGERPTTPENRPDAMFAVLRSSRSSTKRKSRMIVDEDESDASGPSTSKSNKDDEDEEEDRAGDLSILEESECEGTPFEEHDAVIKLSLPFARDEDEDEEEEMAGAREELAMRTPSPIGDAAGGDLRVRATPACNTVATEREVVRRVTRSAAATITACSLREMVVVERPATRRASARRLLVDSVTAAAVVSSPAASVGAAAPSTPSYSTSSTSTTTVTTRLLRTPKHVLQVEDTKITSIASRTRSRNGEVTPPSSLTPVTSVSGSRKRPRTSANGICNSSTAMPMLAKISLAEARNENADSSMDSDEASAAAGSPAKKAAGTPSKWKRANRQPLGPGAL